jgi:HK97 family phage portal protein
LSREELRHFDGWVYASIRPIAQRIAGQPILAGRKATKGRMDRSKAVNKDRAPRFIKTLSDGVEAVDSHPLLDALRTPNDLMTGWALMYVTVATMELAGLSYWYLDDDKDGLRIWPLPPSWVLPEHSEDELFVSYKVTPMGVGAPIDVPADQMLRLAYPDPSDPLIGAKSPLQAAGRSVSADESIETCQYRAFKNGINPGLALIVGRHPDAQTSGPGLRPILDKAQRNQLIQAVKQAYAGAYNHDEPLILDGLIEDAKRISNTNREMDFLASSGITKGRITQTFGVNPIIMGELEGANRASAAAADDHFLASTVNPKIELLSETLTRFLAPRYGDEGLLLWIEPARANDPDATRADREQALAYGLVKRNEARAWYDLPPLDGEEGEELVQPGGGQPVLAGEVGALRALSFRQTG